MCKSNRTDYTIQKSLMLKSSALEKSTKVDTILNNEFINLLFKRKMNF